MISGLSLVLATSASAQSADSWTQSNYSDLEAKVVASSEASGQPVVGLTIMPETFKQDIGTGYVSYAALIRSPFNIDGAPKGTKEIFLRSEFFREQSAPQDGGHNFRSIQTAFVADCANREIAMNGFTRFERNETEGSAVYFVEGTTSFSEMRMASPSAGTVLEAVMLAVCDGQFMYSPSSSG